MVRGEHVREVLTGYRSGHAELAREDEPRPQFDPRLPLESRYAAKAAELSVTDRTVKRWVRTYRQHGVAGLVDKHLGQPTKVDSRWVETAIEVMVEHTDQSRPSQTMVINRTNARVVARFGEGVVRQPSRSTAYRVLHDLEKRYPTFRLSTKRNLDIADRPTGVYGKLRPTGPGEYLMIDTTRLDVFALDPVTLRWVQAELTVGMDWRDLVTPNWFGVSSVGRGLLARCRDRVLATGPDARLLEDRLQVVLRRVGQKVQPVCDLGRRKSLRHTSCITNAPARLPCTRSGTPRYPNWPGW